MKEIEDLQFYANGICVVCGDETMSFGIFVPDEPHLYGAPKGKGRAIRYPLCEECSIGYRLPEPRNTWFALLVERRLRNNMKAGEIQRLET